MEAHEVGPSGHHYPAKTVVRTTAVKLKMEPALEQDLAYTYNAVGEKARHFFRLLLLSRGKSYVRADGTLASEAAVLGEQAEVFGPHPEILKDFVNSVVTNTHNVVISYVSALYQQDSKIGLSSRKSKKTGEQNPIDPGRLLCREIHDMGIFPVVANDLPHGGYYKAAWIAAFSAYKSWHEANESHMEAYAKLEADLARAGEEIAGLDPELQARGRAWVASMEARGYPVSRRFQKRWPATRKDLLSGKSPRSYDSSLFDRAPIEHLDIFIDESCLRLDLERKLPGAKVPSLGPDNIPLLLSVSGTNTVPVVLNGEGSINGEVLLIDAGNPTQCRKVPFACLKSRYFEDLVVETVKQGSTRVCKLTYHKGNADRVPVQATVKEPRIRRRGKGWYLDLIQNVEAEPVEKIGYFFGKGGEPRLGMKVISVDLGVNPLAAISTYLLGSDKQDDDSIPVDGFWANLIGSERIGTIRDRDFHDRVWDLRRRMTSLKRVIRYRCNVLNGRDTHPKAEQSFEDLSIPFLDDPVPLKRFILDSMSSIRNEYLELRRNPTRMTGVTTEQFVWIQATREFLSLQQTWKYGGVKSDRPKTKGDFAGLWRYFNNLKKDLIRKVAATIRQACQGQGVSVLLVENLGAFDSEDKGTNRLTEIWCPATILSWVNNAVGPHGVNVVDVDHRFSSQIDPRTGEFGFRDKAAKTELLVRRGERVEKIDADVSASRVLQHRFWTQYSNLNNLKCRKSDDGWVPNLGIRAKKYVLTKTGSAQALIKDGTLVPAKPKKFAAAEKKATGRPETLYRHGERWVDWDTHCGLRQEIFKDYQASGDLGYINKVKTNTKNKLRRTSRV